MNVFIDKGKSLNALFNVKKIYVKQVGKYINISVQKNEDPINFSYSFESFEKAEYWYKDLKDRILSKDSITFTIQDVPAEM